MKTKHFEIAEVPLPVLAKIANCRQPILAKEATVKRRGQ
jgi:hypothetical protein